MKLYKNTDRLARNIIKLQYIHQTDQKLQRLRWWHSRVENKSRVNVKIHTEWRKYFSIYFFSSRWRLWVPSVGQARNARKLSQPQAWLLRKNRRVRKKFVPAIWYSKKPLTASIWTYGNMISPSTATRYEFCRTSLCNVEEECVIVWNRNGNFNGTPTIVATRSSKMETWTFVRVWRPMTLENCFCTPGRWTCMDHSMNSNFKLFDLRLCSGVVVGAWLLKFRFVARMFETPNWHLWCFKV